MAKLRVDEEGLSSRINLLLEDYRDLSGQFDKLVSIEMIEAVGYQFYSDYFKKCSSLLKADGLMVLQAITIADQQYKKSIQSVDFIQKYIFPGGCLPSVSCMGERKAFNPRGFIKDKNTNALWGMQFIWPIKADFRVVYLSNDHSYTIIGRNKRDYVWLMSRTPLMSESDYSDAISFIEEIGYDISKIAVVPQKWPE